MAVPDSDITSEMDYMPVTRSSYGEMLSRLAVTPYPAWGFAASLFATTPHAYRLPLYTPRPLSCMGFGTAMALGGYIILDDDPINGAGFASAWSILYCMANGRRGITQLKPWPAMLSLGAAANALVYGREFFFPDSERTKL
ncbi:uncharacterized protein V1518DRAFT_426060 [Limtongia smithiae]|uniref:uncharacterized protein n=1 Tax=Limtongia smithiae TaxID=1125753 RepID=UPI0034CDAAAC